MPIHPLHVTFLSLLGLLFIGLKLGGAIDWSWWLVLLPLYGPVLFFAALFIGLFLLAVFISLLDG